MVEEHYPTLGFTKIEGTQPIQYKLEIANYQELKNHITKK